MEDEENEQEENEEEEEKESLFRGRRMKKGKK